MEGTATAKFYPIGEIDILGEYVPNTLQRSIYLSPMYKNCPNEVFTLTWKESRNKVPTVLQLKIDKTFTVKTSESLVTWVNYVENNSIVTDLKRWYLNYKKRNINYTLNTPSWTSDIFIRQRLVCKWMIKIKGNY